MRRGGEDVPMRGVRFAAVDRSELSSSKLIVLNHLGQSHLDRVPESECLQNAR